MKIKCQKRGGKEINDGKCLYLEPQVCVFYHTCAKKTMTHQKQLRLGNFRALRVIQGGKEAGDAAKM